MQERYSIALVADTCFQKMTHMVACGGEHGHKEKYLSLCILQGSMLRIASRFLFY